jgi:hypothetical protein
MITRKKMEIVGSVSSTLHDQISLYCTHFPGKRNRMKIYYLQQFAGEYSIHSYWLSALFHCGNGISNHDERMHVHYITPTSMKLQLSKSRYLVNGV